MNEYIKSSLYAYSGGTSIKHFLKTYLTDGTFRYICAFRLVNDKGIKKILGIILWRLRDKHISIPKETKIGHGFCIGHGPVVINRTAVLGNNVRIAQFVTIGSNEGHAAVIGNCVYIGPNSCVVERVHIGDNVTIGAGSVVTKDIPNNATAAGNYARVLNYNNPARYIINKWKVQ